MYLVFLNPKSNVPSEQLISFEIITNIKTQSLNCVILLLVQSSSYSVLVILKKHSLLCQGGLGFVRDSQNCMQTLKTQLMAVHS